MTFVCLSQLVHPVLQGSHLGLIHHSFNYGKPSRLETCKFFVASRLAYKAERAGFYAQLNIDDRPCYSWWMSFIIRWCHCFWLLMRAVNQVISLHCRYLRRLIFSRQWSDLHTIVPLQEAWINIGVVSVAVNKNSGDSITHCHCWSFSALGQSNLDPLGDFLFNK